MNLCEILIRGARNAPEALAVKGPDGQATYSELNSLANRFARALTEMGVKRGDRVGIWLDKSVSAVVAMQGILRVQAIYVPLDAQSPTARIQTILRDCSMRALITTRKRADAVLGGKDDLYQLACLCLDDTTLDITYQCLATFSGKQLQISSAVDDEIAYILYTSGSTGIPKGVCISHRNALAFIEWAALTLQANEKDRFASHAPFHFDLSVFDLYVAFYANASVFLIPEGMSYLPQVLVQFILAENLTIWYSVPSALVLMLEYGGILEVANLPLRAILFAGEPFALKHLRRLYSRWPDRRYLNLYGPTETNVCTFCEVTERQINQNKPVPIGQACSGDTIWVQREDGTVAQVDEEGELMVSGPTVMVGYWGKPGRGNEPYATGDLVRLQADGNYLYVGRRDHMVKVRGHRIELGDVEATLENHPALLEAAVIVVGSEIDARLVAFVVSNGDLPSLLSIKQHCATHLPRYMIVDTIHFLPALPRTRNGKVDRLLLTCDERYRDTKRSENNAKG